MALALWLRGCTTCHGFDPERAYYFTEKAELALIASGIPVPQWEEHEGHVGLYKALARHRPAHILQRWLLNVPGHLVDPGDPSIPSGQLMILAEDEHVADYYSDLKAALVPLGAEEIEVDVVEAGEDYSTIITELQAQHGALWSGDPVTARILIESGKGVSYGS
jgi:hypothetical protein